MAWDADRVNAYKYLLKEERIVKDKDGLDYYCGKQSEIGEGMTRSLFEQLCAVGYIQLGADGCGDPRWELTEHGKSHMMKYLRIVKKSERLGGEFKKNMDILRRAI